MMNMPIDDVSNELSFMYSFKRNFTIIYDTTEEMIMKINNLHSLLDAIINDIDTMMIKMVITCVSVCWNDDDDEG